MSIEKKTFKNHDEWLEIRSHYIGGSDAGAVIGMNPYKSAYALWAEKTGKVPAFEGNLTTKVGSYLEDLVAKLFEEETGKKVHKSNFTYVNDKYPFACANVDRLISGEKAVLEIKTTNNFSIIKTLRGTEFPDAYYAQVVHYLAVTELEKAYLAVLVNCRELKIFELKRDEEEIKALMDAEKHFWDCVETDTPPCVDGSSSTTDALTTIYADSNGEAIDLFGIENVLCEYEALNNQLDNIKTLVDEKKNQIKEYMGNAETGMYDKFKVSWKTQAGRKSFDDKLFAKMHPEIDLTSFYKVSASSRPLRITISKEK